jgi:hypothetical protein
MNFKRSEIKNVKKTIMRHAKEIDLLVMREDEDTLLATLDSVVDRPYEQGEQISPEHMNIVKDSIKEIVQKTAGYVKTFSKDPKKPLKPIKNAADYVTTLTDYYFVLAMEKLGCPNMQVILFDPEVKGAVEKTALAIDRLFPKYNVSKEQEFTQQRGKDARELEVKFTEHSFAIDNKDNLPKHMGELVAQYQALKQRQQNHWPIWRFFHKSENKARNSLLNRMEKKLKATLHKSMRDDLDSLNPAKVSRAYADGIIRGEIEVAGQRRLSSESTKKIFGTLSTDQTQIEKKNTLLESDNKVPMGEDKDFVADINGNKEAKIEPVKEDKSIEKDNIIAMDDNSFALLN